MICPSCGAEAADDAAFCTKCGVKLEAPKTETSVTGPSAGNIMHNETAGTRNAGMGPIQKWSLFGAFLGFVLAFGVLKDNQETGMDALAAFSMRAVVGAILGAIFGGCLIVRRKMMERKAMERKEMTRPRIVVDRLPNAAENAVRPIAIVIAWLAAFQIAVSCFDGPAGPVLSMLFGILGGSLHIVLWWALWNGLRRIGSPVAKYVLVFVLAWTMAVPVQVLSFGLAPLLESSPDEAQEAIKCGAVFLGLLGIVGCACLVAFPVAVEKNHIGRLLSFSLLIWPILIGCGICMAIILFVGLPLAFLYAPPIVCNVVVAFLLARILAAPSPERKSK